MVDVREYLKVGRGVFAAKAQLDEEVAGPPKQSGGAAQHFNLESFDVDLHEVDGAELGGRVVEADDGDGDTILQVIRLDRSWPQR